MICRALLSGSASDGRLLVLLSLGLLGPILFGLTLCLDSADCAALCLGGFFIRSDVQPDLHANRWGTFHASCG